MVALKKRVDYLKTILTFKKLQRIEENKSKGIIPKKTFFTCLEKKQHPYFHKIRKEIEAGKRLHSPSDAPTEISERKRVLQEWTKGQPTNIPCRILSNVGEDKIDEERKWNHQKKGSLRKLKKVA